MTFRARSVLLGLLCAGIAGSSCVESPPGQDSEATAGPPAAASGASAGPNENPETCLEVQENLRDSGSALEDGVYTLFVRGEERLRWRVLCRGMRWEEPEEYVLVNEDNNWSSAYVGGAEVVTRFSKLRIDPVSLVIDAGDGFGARTTGWQDVGFADSLPNHLPAGFAGHSADAGPAVTARIDLRGSGFVFHDSVATALSTFLCATNGATYSANADRAQIALEASGAGAQVFAANGCAAQDPRAGDRALLWPVAYSGD